VNGAGNWPRPNKGGLMTVDIKETLKSVLERDTSLAVYYEKLPVNGVPDQYIRFKRISTYEEFSHNAVVTIHRDRIQIDCVGKTHADLIAVVALMESSLYFNNIDFKLCLPLEGSNEPFDGSNVFQKDFNIWYL
jgi:hypothetical protein